MEGSDASGVTALYDDHIREQTMKSVIKYSVSLLGIGEGAIYRIALFGLKCPDNGVKARRPPLDVHAHQVSHSNTNVDIRSRWVLILVKELLRRGIEAGAVAYRAPTSDVRGWRDHRLAGADP
jgi:hypothetical protein